MKCSLPYGLISQYDVVDGANPSFIKALKLQIGEDPDYDKVITRHKSERLGDDWIQGMMRIIPVNFNKEHKAMLGRCKMIFDHQYYYQQKSKNCRMRRKDRNIKDPTLHTLAPVLSNFEVSGKLVLYIFLAVSALYDGSDLQRLKVLDTDDKI